MTAKRHLGIVLLLVVSSVSMIGCVEEGPQGEAGAPGPPGQAGEVITVVTPPEDVAPLPSDADLSLRQAQPRVRFDAAALPAGMPLVEIVSASPARLRVAFQLTDDNGDPIDRAALDPLRFTLAHLVIDANTGLSSWFSDVLRAQSSPLTGLTVMQAADETNGTYDDLGNGVVRYTFASPLPDDFDPTSTYRIGVQARRRVDTRQFVDNATFDFRPNGGASVATRDVVPTANCQRCHEPFAFHGGIRTEVMVCVQCHTAQTTDPDTLDPIPNNAVNPHFDPGNAAQSLPNPLDFASMVHRIHIGKELRDERGIIYQIVGFRQTVFDYSHIAFPQDIRTCTTCHSDTTEADNFKISPSRTACGSCHVRTWFGDPSTTPAGLENHPSGPQPDDTRCSSCHSAEGSREFDLSVRGSHINPQRSLQASGVRFTIVRVEDDRDGDERVDPGHAVRVVFHIEDHAGNPILPDAMAFLRLTLAGPTTDYQTQDYNDDGEKTPGEPLRGAPFTKAGEDYVQIDARNAVGPDAEGNFSVTFAEVSIPRDALGTYAVGIEGYACVRIAGLDQRKGGRNCTAGNTAFDEIRDVGPNVVAYFAVTDTTPIPRRTVVDATTRCVACHGVFSKDFAIHGGIRNTTEYCTLCHNPAHDTLGRQAAPAVNDTATTFPINLATMIHKIHRGHDLTTDYFLFSFTGEPIDVREFLYPRDLRTCQACHVTDAEGERTERLIAGKGVLGRDVLPTVHRQIDAMKDILATFATPPITSACTACHDTAAVAAHTELNTTAAGVETCGVCHGEGREFAVDKVHAK